jgi:hypothetical protein
VVLVHRITVTLLVSSYIPLSMSPSDTLIPCSHVTMTDQPSHLSSSDNVGDPSLSPSIPWGSRRLARSVTWPNTYPSRTASHLASGACQTTSFCAVTLCSDRSSRLSWKLGAWTSPTDSLSCCGKVLKAVHGLFTQASRLLWLRYSISCSGNWQSISSCSSCQHTAPTLDQ